MKKMTASSCSSISTSAIRALKLALVAMLVLTVVGCGWFRKRHNESVDTDMGDRTAASPSAPQTGDGLPADAQPETPRPTILKTVSDMQTIYFDFDKSTIRPDQLNAMENNLAFLKKNPAMIVYIIGHCDEQGTTEYNFALGNRRAEAVRDYFVKNGVPAASIQTLSKGEEEPVALGHDEAAYAQNRRAEFKSM
jgi:peptidoglycan-associated lipoprotein